MVDIECPDISNESGAYTAALKNSTFKKNELSQPKISVLSREVGGKATFTCPQGFMTEGSSEAVCQSSGQWSASVPFCRGVHEMPFRPLKQNLIYSMHKINKLLD